MKKTIDFKLYSLLAIRCCLLALCLLSAAYSDTNTEDKLKTSFVYNFAKFVTWPNISSTDTKPLFICTLGSQPLIDHFSQLQGKKVNAQSIEVRSLSRGQPIRDCKILFIAESEIPLLEKTLLSLTSSPILTISTIPDFVHANGMIGLKVLDDLVRFDVNLQAVQKAGLTVNSQLSSRADEVVK